MNYNTLSVNVVSVVVKITPKDWSGFFENTANPSGGAIAPDEVTVAVEVFGQTLGV